MVVALLLQSRCRPFDPDTGYQVWRGGRVWLIALVLKTKGYIVWLRGFESHLLRKNLNRYCKHLSPLKTWEAVPLGRNLVRVRFPALEKLFSFINCPRSPIGRGCVFKRRLCRSSNLLRGTKFVSCRYELLSGRHSCH